MKSDPKKIRARRSYKDLKRVIDIVHAGASPWEIAELVFQVIDGRSGYGSQTNADYAKESLELLKQEEGKT